MPIPAPDPPFMTMPLIIFDHNAPPADWLAGIAKVATLLPAETASSPRKAVLTCPTFIPAVATLPVCNNRNQADVESARARH